METGGIFSLEEEAFLAEHFPSSDDDDDNRVFEGFPSENEQDSALNIYQYLIISCHAF